MSGRTIRVRVTIGALYHDGHSFVTGQELDVSEADAKVLLARGEVEKAK